MIGHKIEVSSSQKEFYFHSQNSSNLKSSQKIKWNTNMVTIRLTISTKEMEVEDLN